MSNMILTGDQHIISGDEVIEEKPLSPRREKKCPKCGEVLTERFARPFAVKTLLFWLPLKRYKCDLCYHKPYFFGEYSRKRASFI